MAKFTLAFGLHNHQPVGNFESVIADAHARSYAPVLELVSRYPQLRLSLHQSGILWRWQQRNRPDYFDLVRSLIASGQVELMTGGFYEPILISIPQRDASGQIAYLTRYLSEQFSSRPTGAWLTERIWEPHVASLLADSGISYIPVDDTHFLYAGCEPSQLTGPFVTENEGKSLVVLPIRKRLRYLIPFGTIDELFDDLKGQADLNPDGVAVYADDGEKFGVWPNTWQHCFADRWLDQFAEAVERNSDWLTMQPLAVAATKSPVGRVYLPSASYEEMLHWALPTAAWKEYDQFSHWLAEQGRAEKFGRFVRGGHWRGFLSKYEEANLMHKRMLDISDQIETARREGKSSELLQAATDHLYAAQCNCPYWHGVFGGLYLPHIRQAIYEELLTAQSLLQGLEPPRVSIRTTDLDRDGFDDLIALTPLLGAVISPRWGGRMTSLFSIAHQFELTDTLSRRTEGYHDQVARAISAAEQSSTTSIHDQVLAKEPNLSSHLTQDWYLKRSFIDHFLHEQTTPDQFRTARFGEEGDFILEAYQCERFPAAIRLTRHGKIWRSGGAVPIVVEKQFTFEAAGESFDVAYSIHAAGPDVQVLFAVEQNYSFQAGHADDRLVLIDSQQADAPWLDAQARHQETRTVQLVDHYRKLAVGIATDRPAELWRMPIFTVSQSEGGFEKVYQGTTLLHLFRLNLTQSPRTIRFHVALGRPAVVSQLLENQAAFVASP